ncbi:hypothetical protein D9758_002414 [Tetrapyrgos nigripes]|uniref:AB hydrolase-1 domain-containing protein n=1 Tax=Tetrapyrgos nigripes TaxID=182062 RepID=A0A8H5GP83_9AGAR|nr:hypothetical protein D9758_002414 [Tetrapyrgos nigripes]
MQVLSRPHRRQQHYADHSAQPHSSSSIPSSHDPFSSSPSSYSFPSIDDSHAPVTPKGHQRKRSTTGPSVKQKPTNWIDRTPSLGGSRSSSRYSYNRPETPVDSFSLDFPVQVAAPISGVEMMDALVDGMNGGEPILVSSRQRFGIPGHHPLYQPPLPTPPPGVVLGGGKARSRKTKRSTSTKAPSLYYSSDEEDDDDTHSLQTTPRRRGHRIPSRQSSTTTLDVAGGRRSSVSLRSEHSSLSDDGYHRHTNHEGRSRTAPSTPSSGRRRSLAPSISDIIRAYAPDGQVRPRPLSRTPSYSHSTSHSTVHEEAELEPEPLTIKEEADLLSRSSIDSIAEEVQRTLRHQASLQVASHRSPPPPAARRYSVLSDSASILSPRSDGGGAASIYASSVISQPPPSPFGSSSFMASLTKPSSPSQAVAQYLRSARLTTLLRLTRSPHASFDNPLTVSLSDLGDQKGYPIVIFLGLGCVRHIMGLYDEMAELLGLRLITIDRWGLGRTEPRAKSAKGIMQWASVVEEVLDLLHIDQCGVMAHSAGAPYALSFANKLKNRIRGDICLLAPWVGGSETGSYKWLKYVPNGLLKTAQAAEWKLQTWTIGKPPTVAWEGIGHTAENTKSRSTGPYSTRSSEGSRPSVGSGFSDYDDLRDFDGRFESRSTLGTHLNDARSASDTKVPMSRKTSKGFLGRLKGGSSSSSTFNSQPQSPSEGCATPPHRLKALRSMSSLKSKSSSRSKNSQTSPRAPPTVNVDIGLGLDELNWTKDFATSERSQSSTPVDSICDSPTTKSNHNYSTSSTRSQGRRSISFSSSRPPLLSLSPDLRPPDLSSNNNNHKPPPSPSPSSNSKATSNSTTTSTTPTASTSNAYQSLLGNALIAASHSESAKGTHNDLLQILNHDNHPWGFSYQAYPHSIRVWYGDKDEKIAENAVRWMEKTIGEDRCSVKVVKGADHGLMFKSGVVIDALECLAGFWEGTRDSSEYFCLLSITLLSR